MLANPMGSFLFIFPADGGQYTKTAKFALRHRSPRRFNAKRQQAAKKQRAVYQSSGRFVNRPLLGILKISGNRFGSDKMQLRKQPII
jgi:hypothetical protein